MAKKISFGKFSLNSADSKDQDTNNSSSVSSFGLIEKLNKEKTIIHDQNNNIDAKQPAFNKLKQAQTFDVDKMMSEFNNRVEKTKISSTNLPPTEKDEDESEDFVSQMMGFSGFGKKINVKAADKSKKADKLSSKPTKQQKPVSKAVSEATSSKVEQSPSPRDVPDDESTDESEDEDVIPSPEFSLPISHVIKLNHAAKAVSGIALDPAGARLITGSQDFDMKFWDFNAMDARFMSFRTIQPMANYHIRSIEYSITGDSLLVASGGPQIKILDRDGSEIYESRKGDQYIVDMGKTNGHVAAVYNAVWHIKDRNTFMTCSQDCTVRMWDINNTRNQKTVIRMKGKDNKKVMPTHCAYNKDSTMFAVATVDGGISVYPSKGPFIRSKILNRAAHASGSETSCLRFSVDGNRLLSRGGDDTMKLWDIRNMKEAVHTAGNLDNVFIGTDCWFSPDEKVVMTGTSVKRGSGELVFYEAGTFREISRFSVGEASVSKILWHPKLNQIIAGFSNGVVKIYYSPELSNRGALLCAAKQRRRLAKNDEIPTNIEPQIINPYSLPMFREQRFLYAKRRKDKARRDPEKSSAPDKPAWGLDAHKTKGCSLSAHESKRIALDLHGPPAEEEDPRDVLLRFAETCEKDPYWIAPAYGPEQKNIYQDVTEDTLKEEPPEKKPMYFYNK